MKLITIPKKKKAIFYSFKNTLRNIVILLSYTLGFTFYALAFLIWTLEVKSDNLYWLLVPIVGLSLGIIHLVFVYKGSLMCKAITMFSILIYVFSMPLIVALVN